MYKLKHDGILIIKFNDDPQKYVPNGDYLVDKVGKNSDSIKPDIADHISNHGFYISK